MAEHVAASLEVLLKQINARWPERDKESDGAKGDKAHAGRKSDHNPNSQGVICARDFTHDSAATGPKGRFLANALIASKDNRIKYIISDKEICSGLGDPSHPPWQWRPYTGTNAHQKHMHISVRSPASLYEDKTPWNLSAYAQEDAVGSTIWLQRQLNKHGYGLKEDGDYGPATQKAVRAFAVATLSKA